MTALGGIWNFSGSESIALELAAILDAQSGYGRGCPSCRRLDHVAFGLSLSATLPEDQFDSQPLVDEAGCWMMIADARFDNRGDLLALLGLPVSATLSDAEILFRLWHRRREAALREIVGDFAFAIWNAREKNLVLVRDPTGQRPLHFHRAAGFVAFASMPVGVLAHPQISRGLDEEQLIAFAADIPRDAGRTYFKNVQRVDPGEIINISAEGISRRRYWQLPDRELYFPKDTDYLEAFREQIDRAVEVRLRGVQSRVGVQLSAGLDSGAVASTAARMLAPNGRVVAFTSAPRLGFDQGAPPPRVADESPLAGEVAALYRNIRHVIVRSGGVSPIDSLSTDAGLFQEPVGHPCNQVWLSKIASAAQGDGLKVMLTGDAGNLAFSAGSIAVLSRLIRSGNWAPWLKEVRALRNVGFRRRGVFAASFGPWIPRPIWRVAARFSSTASTINAADLLRSDLRLKLLANVRRNARGGRPVSDERAARWQALRDSDPGTFRKGVLGRWGIDERDPTSDRRLIEFCLALPPQQILKDGVTRRLARTSLADRLPEAILRGVRGYQFADWYESINQSQLNHELDELQASGVEFLDFASIRDLIAAWPPGNWNRFDTIATYRLALLRALSAARFAQRFS